MTGEGGTMRTRAVSIGTKPRQICGENPNRSLLLITNNTGHTIYVVGKKTDTYKDGIPIATTKDRAFAPCTCPVYLVMASGTVDDGKVCTITEPEPEVAITPSGKSIVKAVTPTRPVGGGGSKFMQVEAW